VAQQWGYHLRPEKMRGGNGVRSGGPWNGGRRGGVGGVTRGTATEEGPGRRLRPDHGGYGQRAAEHVTSREMSERES
jgi:hypothetical protein